MSAFTYPEKRPENNESQMEILLGEREKQKQETENKVPGKESQLIAWVDNY